MSAAALSADSPLPLEGRRHAQQSVDDLWSDFGKKADAAGKSRSAVILALLRGYADGTLQVPED